MKLHVQYVNEPRSQSGITLTKQQARLQSREDILRRKQELIVEVGDNDSPMQRTTDVYDAAEPRDPPWSPRGWRWSSC